MPRQRESARTRQIVSMLLCTIVAVAACSDSNAPSAARVTQPIYNIKVPATAAPADSIRISFTYSPGACDSALTVEARPTPGQLRFAVTAIPTNNTCPYGLPIAQIIIPVVYVVPPPHPLPYTVSFAEPDQPDSVRVVAATP